MRLLLGLAKGGWTDASGDLNYWHDQWGNAEVARFWLRKPALASPEIAAEFDDPSLTAPEETPEEEDASARAMLDLGLDLIEMGQTDDGDRFVRQAAEKGSVSAQHRLGKRLAERGDDEGERWLQRAAEQGSGDAAADLAAILLQRGGSGETKSRWRSAAEQGDGAAAYILGLLRDGRGDGADALQWLRLAVGHGSTPAAYRLSTMAPEPAGDDERSLRLAAEQGDAKAANNLGVTLDQRGRWRRPSAGTGRRPSRATRRPRTTSASAWSSGRRCRRPSAGTGWLPSRATRKPRATWASACATVARRLMASRGCAGQRARVRCRDAQPRLLRVCPG